jgi:hypothetical protein
MDLLDRKRHIARVSPQTELINKDVFGVSDESCHC